MVIDVMYEIMVVPLDLVNHSQEHVELKWVSISDLIANNGCFTLSSDAYLKLRLG